MSAALTFPKIPNGWSEIRVPILNGQISLTVYSRAKALHKRVLFIVHGQGEQSGRYEHFPYYLQNSIDTVVALDLPGHGLSKGIRGHIRSFSEFSDAVYEAFSWVEQHYPEAEKHWLGHSLGGLITLYSLFKYRDLPIKTVTVSTPLLDLKMPVPKIKSKLAEMIAPVLGFLPLGNELPVKYLSRDLNVVNNYTGNPMNHGYVTPRFFVELMKTMPSVLHNKGPFNYSLLVIVPLEDLVVKPSSVIHFYNEVQMTAGHNKKICKLPNFYHESFNDLDKEIPFKELSEWIQSGGVA